MARSRWKRSKSANRERSESRDMMLPINSNAADSGHGPQGFRVNDAVPARKRHVTCHKFRPICIETRLGNERGKRPRSQVKYWEAGGFCRNAVFPYVI